MKAQDVRHRKPWEKFGLMELISFIDQGPCYSNLGLLAFVRFSIAKLGRTYSVE